MSDTIQTEEGEIGTESLYVPKTDAEIKELAFGVRAGTVFGTWSVEPRDIGMVFMPLLLGDALLPKQIERDGILHFYSYVDDQHTFPRSVNGMPCFHKIYPLNRDDTERLQKALDELRAFMGDTNADD
jgi:hypothetical protein